MLQQDINTTTGIRMTILLHVYNAASFLPACIDSILNQTMRDIEIICVNDCSTDGSKDILNYYAAIDSRILVIDHDSHKGVLQSRKTGTLASRGEFILFVDNDCYLDKDFCLYVYAEAQATNADIVHFSTSIDIHSEEKEAVALEEESLPFSGKLFDSDILIYCFEHASYRSTLWNKIFRRSLMMHIFSFIDDERIDLNGDIYLYFFVAYFAKLYVGIRGRSYYTCRYGGEFPASQHRSLFHFEKLCAQSLVSDRIKRFLMDQGSFARYQKILNNISQILIESCVCGWLTDLDDRDSACGFDIMIHYWGVSNIIQAVAELSVSQTELVAKKLKGAEAFRLNVRPTRVIGLFYFSLRHGGAERVIASLIPIWRSIGYSIVLFTDESPHFDDFPVDAHFERVVLPASFNNNPHNYGLRARCFRELVIEHNIDIFVHNGGSSDTLLLDLISIKSTGIPVIVSCHEAFSASIIWLGDMFYKKLWVYKFVDKLVVLSRTDVMFWTQLGIKATYIPNPLHFLIRDIIPSKLDTNNVIWIGRLSDEKQYLEAVHIFSIALKRVPQAKLFIIGKAASHDVLNKINDEISLLGIEENVVICGHVRELSYFYSLACVYLSTSYTESFSMTLFEAAAYGIPAVMYAIPHLELVQGGQGIVSIEQGNRNAAAKAIEYILIDHNYRINMGSSARKSAESFVDRSRISEDWNRVLRYNEFEDADAGTIGINTELNVILETIIFHYKVGLQNKLKPEIARLDDEKARFEKEKARLENEQARLESDKTSLVHERRRMENARAEDAKINQYIMELEAAHFAANKYIKDLDAAYSKLIRFAPLIILKRIAEFACTIGSFTGSRRLQEFGRNLWNYHRLLTLPKMADAIHNLSEVELTGKAANVGRAEASLSLR
jgi:glycosyltransferase involved in cell wall biosynthesis